MPAARKAFSMDHPIIITFLIFAIIGFMYMAAEVLKPLALAILLAFALAPLCVFLEKRGLPRFVSVILTIGLTLGVLGFVGYKVGQQLGGLANNVPEYITRVKARFNRFGEGQSNTVENVKKIVGSVSETIEPKSVADEKVQDVRVVNSGPSLMKQVAETIGPYLESVGVLAFVLVLVLFILNTREDLADRMIRLFGRGKISLTTKTSEEIGHRISKYLGTFAIVNSSVGLIVGIGLWCIGLEYALLWGVLAGALRFVPYAGPGTAFALPFAFSFAFFPPESWGPLWVFALFATMEIVMNSFLEPVIYGKSTGISALGLLVAAMFWTWLWGALGLLLSTPLTVCLAVMGKYVPALKVFATFLGEETPLKPDVRFYQRLLAHDADGATNLADEALKEKSRAELFDEVFIPTLSMTERDFLRDDIDERERDFSWWVIEEILQDLESTPVTEAKSTEPAALPASETVPTEEIKVVGIPVNDKGDLIPLRMLQSLLGTSNCRLDLFPLGETPLQIVERLSHESPAMVIVSHLPPDGMTTARYLIRRLRARFPNMPILVGRWSIAGEGDSGERLTSVGATQIVSTLAEARDRILGRSGGQPPDKPAGSARKAESVGV